MRLNRLITILTLAFISSAVFAQDRKQPQDVNLDAMLSEIQYSSDDPDFLEMIWWLPNEFWMVSNSQDPTSSEAESEEIANIMGDYVIIAVVKGEIGLFGGIDFVPLSDLREQVKVTYKGESLTLLEQNDLPADLKNFTVILQPMLSNMFGSMGENMHFLVFDNPASGELLPVDPYGTEPLEFELGKFKPVADLPLSSLIMEKICPTDNALMNGKFNYCPYHGTELVSQ